MKHPISAFIIVKNAEKLIPETIRSIQNLVSEIIVIDSGSTDNTVKVAEELGCLVVFNKWPGYVKQKIFGEKLCKHRWILNLDADEALSKDLQNEIDYIFQSDLQDKFKGYRLKFLILMPGEEKPRMGAPSNTFIRLYNKDYVSFANNKDPNSTHDRAMLSGMQEQGNILLLLSPAYHKSFTSISGLVSKMNFFTDEAARNLVEEARKISKLRLVFEFWVFFFKYLFIRRYFVFGLYGVIYSYVFAFSRFMRLAKAYELQKLTK